jgi:hypothetical protein
MRHEKIMTNLQAATSRLRASLYSDGVHAADRRVEATIPVGSSSSQTSDIQPAAAEVVLASKQSNGSTATRRNPVQEVQERRRDVRTWHIIPKKGWYGAVGRAEQSQSAVVAGIEALEQGCKWWLRKLQ